MAATLKDRRRRISWRAAEAERLDRIRIDRFTLGSDLPG
jgi:hypothetical protein